jgi:hypothetical protein
VLAAAETDFRESRREAVLRANVGGTRNVLVADAWIRSGRRRSASMHEAHDKSMTSRKSLALLFLIA